jgi:hypothetical protein
MPERHCWADYLETLEYLSEEWLRVTVEQAGATCLLPAGHEGEHVWTPDREIVVEFAAEREVVN